MGYYKNLEIEQQVEVGDRPRSRRRRTYRKSKHILVRRIDVVSLIVCSVIQSIVIIWLAVTS